MLAIDISSDFLHLLELNIRRKKWQITAQLTQALPKNVVKQQRLADAEQFGQVLQTILKSLSKQRAWVKRKVIIALPVNQTIIKTVSISPGLPQPALFDHLQQIVDSQISTTKTDVFWDYASANISEAAINTDFVITMAQQAVIQTYQEVFYAHQFELKVVDIESYALARAAILCNPAKIEKNQIYGILLLRKELVTLVVIKSAQHIYARAISLEIIEDYQTAILQAVMQLIKSASFGVAHVELSELFLAGECANGDYANFISEKTFIPAQVVTPPAEVQKFFPEESFSRYFLSLGLALWCQ